MRTLRCVCSIICSFAFSAKVTLTDLTYHTWDPQVYSNSAIHFWKRLMKVSVLLQKPQRQKVCVQLYTPTMSYLLTIWEASWFHIDGPSSSKCALAMLLTSWCDAVSLKIMMMMIIMIMIMIMIIMMMTIVGWFVPENLLTIQLARRSEGRLTHRLKDQLD